MADDIKKAQEEVNRKIDDAYDRLQDLKNDDGSVSEELKQLNDLRQRYHVLSEISDQLEKLERLS